MISANLSPLLASHLFDYALNTLWQLPLLAASTWLLIRLARPSVALQHTLWIATLLLAATLPLRTPPAVIRPTTLVTQPTLTASAPILLTTSRPTLLHPRPIILAPRVILRIAQLWLALLAFNLLRLTHAWLTSRRLITRATSSTLDPDFLAACAARLNIPTPKVLLSASETIPAVAGLFHPVLLLPARFEHDYELTAILLHEFAHIRRRDTLVNLLCRLVALPIAWHPVTPLFHARIGQTREILCDALAARATGSSTAYARSLLTLARDIHTTSTPSLATLALFPSKPNPSLSPSLLEERIMKLITPATSTPANRTTRIAAGIALTALATCTAAAFHLQTVAAARRPEPVATLIPVNTRTAIWPLSARSAPAPRKPNAPTRQATAATPALQSQTAPIASPTPPAPPAAPLAALPALPPAAPLPPLPALPPVAPIAPAAPQAAPAPAPAPTPHPRHISIVNGVQRDLTPAERADLDKQLAAAQQQIDIALSHHLIDEKALAAQLKTLNSGEIERQIANAQKQLQSPEFQKQIADAQKLAVDHAINSEDVRKQMDQAIQQIKTAQDNIARQRRDIHIDQAQLKLQLKAASEAIANAKINSQIEIHIDQNQIHKQLEDARKQLDEARRNNQQTQP